MSAHLRPLRHAALALAALSTLGVARAQTVPELQALAAREQPALLKTLQQLVEIESGSSDRAGLDRIAGVIAQRLRELGGQVDLIDPGKTIASPSSDAGDGPAKVGQMVKATFKGAAANGKRVLLIAHMDTVYQRGMLAQQPFRIDGPRAYGLGIADDKQGVATILHLIAMLKAVNFRDFGEITVLINGDEEIGSPGSHPTITKFGAEHDAVLSFEGGGGPSGADTLRLATSGIAAATLTVKGRSSHAGAAPERGVNALYEMAHQVLQMRDLSDPKNGKQLHWTMAKAGSVRNAIPAQAEAFADVRADKVADFEGMEAELRKRIQNKLLPESEVTLAFRLGRPPLQATEASRALAARAKALAAEQQLELVVRDVPTGGGTDAAYAALSTRAPVIEGMGVRGFGAHSSDSEYVVLDSIAPKLVLATRLIMAIGSGKAP
ncbi:glutamate carboxypeptidase [Roseateles aquatilis]|uniref:Glutamate carboxypeptidase n=1 Tax=Roseateles aquatilis TaxID=431061 RepID=A0A246J184_9BURK|nr:glutamate carboxypeptidase [Roseateles aquatilis]OWQ86361.1 glutamate carboxypeptidase [Roseateles aquatilis]